MATKIPNDNDVVPPYRLAPGISAGSIRTGAAAAAEPYQTNSGGTARTVKTGAAAAVTPYQTNSGGSARTVRTTADAGTTPYQNTNTSAGSVKTTADAGTTQYQNTNTSAGSVKTTADAGTTPYQNTNTDNSPAVLKSSSSGDTVLASGIDPSITFTNGTTASAANTSVTVNGQEALNRLIVTSQTGVFDGANVTINLEEQNFSTTNQVTSTTNSPSGGIYQIQFNSGANSFASDAYFTYTSSNILTPGIRTDGYFYANGFPFVGGGNAAIGNFVFSGDTVTISDANQDLNITGNGTGNVNVTANSQIWIFDATGNIILPSNISLINYANGSPYGGGAQGVQGIQGITGTQGTPVPKGYKARLVHKE